MNDEPHEPQGPQVAGTIEAAIGALAALEVKRTIVNQWALEHLHPTLLAVPPAERKKRKNRLYAPYLEAAQAHAAVMARAANRPGHIFVYPLVGTARRCAGGPVRQVRRVLRPTANAA